MNKNVILLSGANSTIGSELAQHFLDDGYELLLLVHKNYDRISHFLTHTIKVYTASCDLSNWNETNAAVQKLISESGKIPYALIHTATVRNDDALSLLDSDPSKWGEILQINVTSAYHAMKCVLPFFIKQGEGRIVLFGSDVSRNGLVCGSSYSASKAAISNLGKSLALELTDSGVLVNTLSPGPVQTVNQHFEEKYKHFRDDYFKDQLSQIPLKRHARISDIYPLCKFLASEKNTYLTGEEIFLTGGKN